MIRRLDKGIDKLKTIILEMARFSKLTVSIAIDAYQQEKDLSKEIFNSSEYLRKLQDEASELSVELIARYQPVATDLRFIKSCMEISYGFSRFGRYAYDISQVLSMFKDLSMCDKSPVKEAGNQANKMIDLSIKAFTERNLELAQKLKKMDKVVNNIYLEFSEKAVGTKEADLKCALSGVLILRYIERIADHAKYIGDSVVYIISGKQDLKN